MGSSEAVTVMRKGAKCYSILTTRQANASGPSYIIRGANDEEVARAELADKSGHVAVTCTGGQPTQTSADCLHVGGDESACRSGMCP